MVLIVSWSSWKQYLYVVSRSNCTEKNSSYVVSKTKWQYHTDGSCKSTRTVVELLFKSSTGTHDGCQEHDKSTRQHSHRVKHTAPREQTKALPVALHRHCSCLVWSRELSPEHCIGITTPERPHARKANFIVPRRNGTADIILSSTAQRVPGWLQTYSYDIANGPGRKIKTALAMQR